MSIFKSRSPFFTVLVALTLLTVIAVPAMISLLPQSMGVFILLYPAVSWLGAILAWVIYPSRRELSVILMIVVWMTFALIWLPYILA